MKQGTASSSKMGSTKVEPRSHGVNVGAVSEIGIKEVHVGRASSMPLYEGRGLNAPMKSVTTYPKGSQK